MERNSRRKKIRARRVSSWPGQSLELESQSELNQTWIAVGICHLPEAVTRGRSRSRGDAVETLTRNTELRMVEQVEELGPELDAKPFGNRSPLKDGPVKVLDSVPAQNRVYARFAAETPVRRGGETIGVKPVVNCPAARFLVASGNHIRAYVRHAQVGAF